METHSLKEGVKCKDCGKFFRTSGLLTFHIKKHHASNPDEMEGPDFTTCLSCGKNFKSRKFLYDHTRQMGNFHDGKCRICPDFEAVMWSQNLKHINEFHKGEIQVHTSQKSLKLLMCNRVAMIWLSGLTAGCWWYGGFL